MERVLSAPAVLTRNRFLALRAEQRPNPPTLPLANMKMLKCHVWMRLKVVSGAKREYEMNCCRSLRGAVKFHEAIPRIQTACSGDPTAAPASTLCKFNSSLTDKTVGSNPTDDFGVDWTPLSGRGCLNLVVSTLPASMLRNRLVSGLLSLAG